MTEGKKYPFYQLRTLDTYSSIPEATAAIKMRERVYPGLRLMISYFVPQPTYKKWVPYWLIRLVRNKKES